MRDLEQLFTDPQLFARGMITRVDHPTIGTLPLLGVPIKLSDTPGDVRTAPPTLGQHTESVLYDELGLSGDAMAELRAQGAI